MPYNEQEESFEETGIGGLDYYITEAKTDTAKFVPIKSPIDTVLVSSQRATAIQADQPVDPDFDFLYIAKSYDVDSYIRTAVDKYIYLVGKEGWRITGIDPAAVDYIKQRLRILPFSSGITFDAAVYEMKMNLILFGNSFTIKGRFSKAIPIPGLKIEPVNKEKPLGALFPANPIFIKPKFNDTGQITGWAYIVDGSEKAVFKPNDVIHITFNKVSNTVYGKPYFLPVMEDIKTYRQLEWLTVMLMNRYLHPLYHFRKGVFPDGKVGKATEADIAKLEEEIRKMNADGVLVTGPDVDIQVKGAESQSIRAEGYMIQWRKGRIYPGMRVSDLVMGENTSATRSTGDTITAEMHDLASAFQGIIQAAINKEIVTPMLLEGGFDVVTQESPAHFEFRPLSLEESMKRNNDTTQLWLNNMITEEEMRVKLLMPALSDSDRQNTFKNLYGAPDTETTTDSPTTGKAVGNKTQPDGRRGKKTSPGGKAVPPPKKAK